MGISTQGISFLPNGSAYVDALIGEDVNGSGTSPWWYEAITILPHSAYPGIPVIIPWIGERKGPH